MYKNKICGVYLITNNLNGMSYAGQNTHCKYRWLEHKKPSRNVTPIDKAIKEFGAENFTFKIEKECLPEELDYYEMETIKKYHTLWPNGYNKNSGGKSGFDICEESIRKHSKSLTGKMAGEKNPFYNHKHTEEVKRKISKIQKGIPSTKYKWITPDGEIREMSANTVSQWHKDWIRVEE